MSPIRSEDRDRYPPDWKAISARIRFVRARFKGEGWIAAVPRCECTGECGLHEGRRCEELHGLAAEHAKGTICLTVAHLDHTPENCADENLRAMCQRCHLRYDRDQHRETASRTRDRKRGQGRLFS